MKRGQASFEFISLVSIMFLMLIIFMAIITDKTIELEDSKNFGSLIEIGNVLQKEVELASKAIPGYIRSFNLPSRLSGKDYNISVLRGASATALIVNYTNFSLRTPYVVKIPKEVYAVKIYPGKNIITKINDIVEINNIPIEAIETEFRI